MMSYVGIVASFVGAWIESSIAVWVALKFIAGRQSNESFAGIAATALMGAPVYWFFNAVFRLPFISGIPAIIVWMYALRKIQNLSWHTALLLAVVMWLVSGVFGLAFIPARGPLS
jgi:hypothetical protein